MNNDDFAKELKTSIDSIVASEELKKKINGIPSQKKEEEITDGSKCLSLSKKEKRSKTGKIVSSIAKVVCIVLAIIGMGTVSVWALDLEEPIKNIFSKDSEVTEKDNNLNPEDENASDTNHDENIADNSNSDLVAAGNEDGVPVEIAEEDYNYTITCEDMIYDDVINVGYLTVFIGKDNGQPFTAEDSSNVTMLMRGTFPYMTRWGSSEGIRFAPFYMRCLNFTVKSESKYLFLYPAGNISLKRKEEDGGVRFYIKFYTVDDDYLENGYVENKGLKMMILDRQDFYEVREELLKDLSDTELYDKLTEYGLSSPEYTGTFIKTISNDVITADIGRTDARLRWDTWRHIKDIVIVRENGTRLYVLKDGELQGDYESGINNNYYHKDIIFSYDEIFEDGENVHIEVDGEVMK